MTIYCLPFCITTLQIQGLDAVRDDLEEELSGNVTVIKKNVTKQFNDVYENMESDYSEIQEEIATVQNDMSLLMYFVSKTYLLTHVFHIDETLGAIL